MVTAFVLLNVDVSAIPEAGKAICDIDGVEEVYSVTGRYDLIVKVVVKEDGALEKVVTGGIAKVPGIAGSETAIAFRNYSDALLDAGFSIGE